ncbi:hypothetical protein P3T36_007553 [Kitasatospora sp. MAP12-15]|uniref:hypothetical protein n=1 Tax=unclassified Kitasatospora TaxID=2633591 RepID=UPI002475EF73|nr:hypothetical protein [Kitasatospora sp. MAP12-44]MDH6108945.1 hypothetical protein [Kitasatospora sp. MAP12-44]
MDIVYASLMRRQAADDRPHGAEVGEVVDVLWAHAAPEDRLEHAGGGIEPNRVDLLLFFLPCDGADKDGSAERRAAALLHRSHQGSPLMQRRYLPPVEPVATRL